MQIFSFDSEVAKEVGVNAAVLFYNIAWWVEKNEANKANFHDGDYWTYNSMKAYTEMFPFMSKQNIRTAIKVLQDGGYIKTGNYNAAAYDRTLWYALTDKGKSRTQNQHFHLPKSTFPCVGSNTPIPDINTDINTDILDNIKDTTVGAKPRRNFVAPSVEEVSAYCKERNNGIDPQSFIDFYDSKGWMIGKNHMKDWKAAVRTWERRHGGEPAAAPKPKPKPRWVQDDPNDFTKGHWENDN